MPGRTKQTARSSSGSASSSKVLDRRDQLMDDRRNRETLRRGALLNKRDMLMSHQRDEATLRHRNDLMRQRREAELLRKRDSLMHRQGTR